MAQPYVGEIRMFAGNFAPAGWAFCDGALLPISEFETLFNLIGTTYGGDGQSTFALPDLRSRIPIHQGNGHTLAQADGSETVTLTLNQIPAHAHPLASSNTAALGSPAGNVVGKTTTPIFDTSTPTVTMGAGATVGGGQPHNNLMPFLAINFIISLFGIFPSQT